MARRRKGKNVHGILLLDKPAGYSSNQAVQKVRWLFGARKAGHTGTLDPFATGMLPICLGEASKTAGFMLDAAKTYRAVARLGQATETGDIEGEIVDERPVPDCTEDDISQVLESFRGQIEQTPPMYSAIRHDGQRLYELARQGIEVERKSRAVTIHRIELIAWKPPLLEFVVTCSKGTYIRTLSEDIAAQLDTCAHLGSLRRLVVGLFQERDMVTLDALEEAVQAEAQNSLLQPVDAGLRDWPRADISLDSELRFCNGNPVPGDGANLPEGQLIRVYGTEDRLLGLGQANPGNLLYPKRVFVW